MLNSPRPTASEPLLDTLYLRVDINSRPEDDWATIEPLGKRAVEASPRADDAVSAAFSELNSPVVMTAKAKTAATTTKAIKTMAVSRPVMPFWLPKVYLIRW